MLGKVHCCRRVPAVAGAGVLARAHARHIIYSCWLRGSRRWSRPCSRGSAAAGPRDRALPLFSPRLLPAQHFVNGRLNEVSKHTVGVEFGSRTIALPAEGGGAGASGTAVVKLQIWDTVRSLPPWIR